MSLLGVEAASSPESTALHCRAWRALTIERRLVGSSLLRIGAGCIVLYDLVGHWSQRELIWGPRGVYPLWLFERDLPLTRSPSFFAVQSELLFNALYVGAIVVALVYTLGWQTRLVGFWFYVVAWSLLKRNPFALTGGDAFFLAELPFLLFMNTSAYLSIDSRWRGIGDDYRPARRPFLALFHNVALFCVLMQLCIVYGFSAFYKMMGDTWQHGTAVYYSLRSQEFVLPGLSPLVYLNAVLVTLLTYGTVAFEIALPFLSWSRATRWIAALGAVTFHVGIALFMGLVVFAAQMLIFQLVVFDDDWYRAWYRRLTTRRRRPRAAPAPPAEQDAASEPPVALR